MMSAFTPHRPALLTALRWRVQLPSTTTFADAPIPTGRPAAGPIPRRWDRRGMVAANAEGSAILANSAQLEGAKDAVADLIRSKSCNPILVRLAWHDAGTYNKVRRGWSRPRGVAWATAQPLESSGCPGSQPTSGMFIPSVHQPVTCAAARAFSRALDICLCCLPIARWSASEPTTARVAHDCACDWRCVVGGLRLWVLWCESCAPPGQWSTDVAEWSEVADQQRAALTICEQCGIFFGNCDLAPLYFSSRFPSRIHSPFLGIISPFLEKSHPCC